MRVSRRNTRRGKARRRAERDRRLRPRTADQGPRNPDEHGSGLRSDADGDLVEADISDVAEVANLAVGDVTGPGGPEGPEDPDESEPDQLAAAADTEAEDTGAADARVVKNSAGGGGEDEEIF